MHLILNQGSPLIMIKYYHILMLVFDKCNPYVNYYTHGFHNEKLLPSQLVFSHIQRSIPVWVCCVSSMDIIAGEQVSPSSSVVDG